MTQPRCRSRRIVVDCWLHQQCDDDMALVLLIEVVRVRAAFT